VLKIATQKFIGLTRSDKKNEMYWKFRDFYEPSGAPQAPAEPVAPKTEPKSDQVNENKVELSAAEPNSERVGLERSPNSFSSEKGLEESATVQKFREKYGTADSPK
jgi:hypothetical protein